jgi:hypothetical protein
MEIDRRLARGVCQQSRGSKKELEAKRRKVPPAIAGSPLCRDPIG